MTEQHGHEEHEQNSARDDDAGFAALDGTEPHLVPLEGSAFKTLHSLRLFPLRPLFPLNRQPRLLR